MDIHQERFYAALGIVMSAARSEIAQCQQMIGSKPAPGWTQERHDEYYRLRKIEAEDAHSWLHSQMRKFNPD